MLDSQVRLILLPHQFIGHDNTHKGLTIVKTLFIRLNAMHAILNKRPQWDSRVFEVLKKKADSLVITYDTFDETYLRIHRHGRDKKVAIVCTKYYVYLFKVKAMKLYFRWAVRDITVAQKGEWLCISSSEVEEAEDTLDSFLNSGGTLGCKGDGGDEDENSNDSNSAVSKDIHYSNFATVYLRCDGLASSQNIYSHLSMVFAETRRYLWRLDKIERGSSYNGNESQNYGVAHSGNRNGVRPKINDKRGIRWDDDSSGLEDTQEEERMTKVNNVEHWEDDDDSSDEEFKYKAAVAAGKRGQQNTVAFSARNGEVTSSFTKNGSLWRQSAIRSIVDSDMIDYNILHQAFQRREDRALITDIQNFVEQNDIRIEELCKRHYVSFMNATKQCEMINTEDAMHIQDEINGAVKLLRGSALRMRGNGSKLISAFSTRENIISASNLIERLTECVIMLERAETLLSNGCYLGALRTADELTRTVMTTLAGGNGFILGQYILHNRAPAIREEAIKAGVTQTNQWLRVTRDSAVIVGESLLCDAIGNGVVTLLGSLLGDCGSRSSCSHCPALDSLPQPGYHRRALFSVAGEPDLWGIVEEYIPSCHQSHDNKGELSSSLEIQFRNSKNNHSSSLGHRSERDFDIENGGDEVIEKNKLRATYEIIIKSINALRESSSVNAHAIIRQGPAVQELFNEAGQAERFSSYYAQCRNRQIQVDLLTRKRDTGFHEGPSASQNIFNIVDTESIVSPQQLSKTQLNGFHSTDGKDECNFDTSSKLQQLLSETNGVTLCDIILIHARETVMLSSFSAPPSIGHLRAELLSMRPQLLSFTTFISTALGTIVLEDIVHHTTSPKAQSLIDIIQIWETIASEVGNRLLELGNYLLSLGKMKNTSAASGYVGSEFGGIEDINCEDGGFINKQTPNITIHRNSAPDKTAPDAVLGCLIQLIRDGFIPTVSQRVQCVNLNTITLQRVVENIVCQAHSQWLQEHCGTMANALIGDTLAPLVIPTACEFTELVEQYHLNLLGTVKVPGSTDLLMLPIPPVYKSVQLYIPYSISIPVVARNILQFVERCLFLLEGPPRTVISEKDKGCDGSRIATVGISKVSGVEATVRMLGRHVLNIHLSRNLIDTMGREAGESFNFELNNIDTIIIGYINILFKTAAGIIGSKMQTLSDKRSLLQFAVLFSTVQAMAVVISVVEQRFGMWWKGDICNKTFPSLEVAAACAAAAQGSKVSPHGTSSGSSSFLMLGTPVIFLDANRLFNDIGDKCMNKMVQTLTCNFDDLMAPVGQLDYWRCKISVASTHVINPAQQGVTDSKSKRKDHCGESSQHLEYTVSALEDTSDDTAVTGFKAAISYANDSIIKLRTILARPTLFSVVQSLVMHASESLYNSLNSAVTSYTLSDINMIKQVINVIEKELSLVVSAWCEFLELAVPSHTNNNNEDIGNAPTPSNLRFHFPITVETICKGLRCWAEAREEYLAEDAAKQQLLKANGTAGQAVAGVKEVGTATKRGFFFMGRKMKDTAKGTGKAINNLGSKTLYTFSVTDSEHQSLASVAEAP